MQSLTDVIMQQAAIAKSIKIAKKMSRQDLIDLYPAYDPSGHKPEKATQKGFVHKQGKPYKPPKSELTPAQWGRKRRGTHKPPYNYSDKK